MVDTHKRSAYKLTWKQREFIVAVDKAVIAAMDETIDACVEQAKINAPVSADNTTPTLYHGALRDNIQVRDYAYISGNRIYANWGNDGLHYSWFVEYGTVFQPAQYYLGRARDQEYPKLTARINKHLAF